MIRFPVDVYVRESVCQRVCKLRNLEREHMASVDDFGALILGLAVTWFHLHHDVSRRVLTHVLHV
ncbi:hypothetical protein MWU75_14130 [Ornithinimicrobium sp. F0845]|uniref:hypothetical protein n=1 Tax=Ornithinimicrobium sp. F0845 TaxID=2926412 RepID=UPI001FF5C85B|nr:hypothetical protein [Ornithinimicrobium sp. F0845]MCK0113283.1 hypothetical protein [Ornithinimicrobium sp. F0845]